MEDTDEVPCGHQATGHHGVEQGWMVMVGTTSTGCAGAAVPSFGCAAAIAPELVMLSSCSLGRRPVPLEHSSSEHVETPV